MHQQNIYDAQSSDISLKLLVSRNQFKQLIFFLLAIISIVNSFIFACILRDRSKISSAIKEKDKSLKLMYPENSYDAGNLDLLHIKLV